MGETGGIFGAAWAQNVLSFSTFMKFGILAVAVLGMMMFAGMQLLKIYYIRNKK
ncbi:MAG: hypothetical protein NTX05_07750 [Fusobacteria bacterium]|nr:hypothetical protein [Fusobacteriota bacterium]